MSDDDLSHIPFMRRAKAKANLSNSHRRAKKQEKELVGRIGGHRTPASGAGAVKGDVRIKGTARIEAKTTKNKSFSVTLEMIDKIESATISTTEVPVMVIEFNDGFGKKLKEVAVLPMYALETLLANQAE